MFSTGVIAVFGYRNAGMFGVERRTMVCGWFSQAVQGEGYVHRKVARTLWAAVTGRPMGLAGYRNAEWLAYSDEVWPISTLKRRGKRMKQIDATSRRAGGIGRPFRSGGREIGQKNLQEMASVCPN